MPILYINPLSVDSYASTTYQVTGRIRDLLARSAPNSLLIQKLSNKVLSLEPFLKPTFLYPTIPVKSSPRFKIVSDLLSNASNPRDSNFYIQSCLEIDKHGYSRYKSTTLKDPNEVLEFIKFYSVKLLGPIELGEELPEFIIDKDLRVLKASRVNHRFCARHFTEDPSPIPVKIAGIHIAGILRHLNFPLNAAITSTIHRAIDSLDP